MSPTPDPLSPDVPTLADHVERLGRSVLGVATRRQAGAAVVLRPGVAVGSASVLWRASGASVILPDGERVGGEVAGLDVATDLAAIRFTADVPVAELAPDTPSRVGDFVFALGRNPSGLAHASFGRVGQVAGEWRTWRGGRVDRLVRLDGGLYPGLEGAPVADAAGRVVGVASASLSRHHGIALPLATVQRVLDDLLAHGRVRRGYLGIAAQPVRVTLDGAEVEGLLVSSVAADGPAARAGLRVSDVILEVAGVAVADLDALQGALAAGATVPVRIARGGARVDLQAEVGERPARRC